MFEYVQYVRDNELSEGSVTFTSNIGRQSFTMSILLHQYTVD